MARKTNKNANRSNSELYTTFEGLEARKLYSASHESNIFADMGDTNDQIVEAQPLSLVSTSSRISHGADVDIYSFQARAGQRLAFDVDRPSGESFDSVLRVFDGTGNQLAMNDDQAAPGESRTTESYIEHTFRSSGTYYLGISGYGNANYSPISGLGSMLSRTGGYTIHRVEIDTDDQISEARTISIGSSRTDDISKGSDVDMYRISVSAGQRVGFDIDTTGGSSFDSVIRLFDANGQSLAYNDDKPAPGESRSGESYLAYTFTDAGTYYLGVSGYGNRGYSAVTGDGDTNGRTGNYQLTLTELDTDDQISEARSIMMGESNNDTISQANDVDMYRFSVAEGQQVTFDIDHSTGSSLDSVIRLFDGSGNQLAWNDDRSAPGESFSREAYLEHTFDNAGEYYLGVSGYGNRFYSPVDGDDDGNGRTGAYTLTLGGDVVRPVIDEIVEHVHGDDASLTVSASDIDGAVDMVRAWLDSNGNGELDASDLHLGTSNQRSLGVWHVGLNGLQQGVNNIFVAGYDNQGNPSNVMSDTVVTAAPPTIDQVTDRAAGTSHVLEVRASDADGSIGFVRAWLDSNGDGELGAGDLHLGSRDAANNGVWSIEMIGLNPGNNDIFVAAYDNLGNPSQVATHNVSRPVAPTIGRINWDQPTLEVRASDADGTIGLVRAWMDSNDNGVLDAGDLHLGSTTQGNNGVFSVNPIGLEPGNNRVFVAAYDNDGLPSQVAQLNANHNPFKV